MISFEEADRLPGARCRRCGSWRVRSLGNAASKQHWYACGLCGHVWGVETPAVHGTATPLRGAPSVGSQSRHWVRASRAAVARFWTFVRKPRLP